MFGSWFHLLVVFMFQTRPRSCVRAQNSGLRKQTPAKNANETPRIKSTLLKTSPSPSPPSCETVNLVLLGPFHPLKHQKRKETNWSRHTQTKLAHRANEHAAGQDGPPGAAFQSPRRFWRQSSDTQVPSWAIPTQRPRHLTRFQIGKPPRVPASSRALQCSRGNQTFRIPRKHLLSIHHHLLHLLGEWLACPVAS